MSTVSGNSTSGCALTTTSWRPIARIARSVPFIRSRLLAPAAPPPPPTATALGRLPPVPGMQEVGEEENMRLEHRLSYLALIGTICPMFGLLGTVDGMVQAFEVIARSAVSPKPSERACRAGACAALRACCEPCRR